MAKRRGNGEGTIWKERGKFRAGVTFPNGKRKTKSFDTHRAAEKWIRKMKNQIDHGLNFESTRISLQEFMEGWLEIHRTHVAERSAHRYAQLARDYVYPHLGKCRLMDLNIDRIEMLYQQLLKEEVSRRNVRYVHSLLHRSFKDAVRRGYLTRNPAHGARKPKADTKEMEFLDQDQIWTFLNSIRGHRHEALYQVAIHTGMRQGELLGLQWSDLDWNNKTLHVQRQAVRLKGKGKVFKPPKTKSGNRTIHVGKEIIEILRQHTKQQSFEREVAGDNWVDMNLIFPTTKGTIQSGSNLLREFKGLLAEAGLEKIKFHGLRHTSAYLLLNNGVDLMKVSRRLGHSQPSTTLNFYGHMIPSHQDEVASKMDDLMTPMHMEVPVSEKLDR